jgi:hypothetical protein
MFTAKLSFMRKPQEFVVCPVHNAEENMIYIQSDKVIGKFNFKTYEGRVYYKGMVSSFTKKKVNDHNGFQALEFHGIPYIFEKEVVEQALRCSLPKELSSGISVMT